MTLKATTSIMVPTTTHLSSTDNTSNDSYINDNDDNINDGYSDPLDNTSIGVYGKNMFNVV